jgi:cytochrome c oxidase assembly protein subunit 15
VALPTISPAGYRRVALVALVALALIMVTGAAVRLTGSGLGCPEWPTCEEGSLVPRGEVDGHGLVEFGNRTITGVVGLAVIVAVLASLRRVPRRRDLTLLSLGLVAGVIAQAVLGGIVVLLELDPVSVIGHFLLSLVLVWNAVLLHHRAGEEPGLLRDGATREVQVAGRLLVVAAAVVIVLGTLVTASGPHGGDADAERLDLDVGAVAQLHGIAVLVFVGLALVAYRLVRRGGADAVVEQRSRALLVVMTAQAGVGYVQYFTGVPAVLVGVHVAGAVAVWIAVLRLVLGMRTRVPVSPASVVASVP